MDQTLKGDGDLCDDEAVRDVLPKCPSPLPHSVPILASPDPDCERFSLRVILNLLCSDCELYFTCFELEMSCMSDIILIVFSFHTPTFYTKVRIS